LKVREKVNIDETNPGRTESIQDVDVLVPPADSLCYQKSPGSRLQEVDWQE
jgi:hypothetical protein